jgi:hypothetical protein
MPGTICRFYLAPSFARKSPTVFFYIEFQFKTYVHYLYLKISACRFISEIQIAKYKKVLVQKIALKFKTFPVIADIPFMFLFVCLISYAAALKFNVIKNPLTDVGRASRLIHVGIKIDFLFLLIRFLNSVGEASTSTPVQFAVISILSVLEKSSPSRPPHSMKKTD